MEEYLREEITKLCEEYQHAPESRKSELAVKISNDYLLLTDYLDGRDKIYCLTQAHEWKEKTRIKPYPANAAGAAASENELNDVVSSMKVVPTTTFDDVGGMVEIKEKIVNCIVLSEICPKQWTKYSNILLQGAPGCGKTMLTMSLANALGRNGQFYLASLDKTLSKWHGESSKIVSRIYETARKEAKKTGQRSIIFFDDFEVQGQSRTVGESNTAISSVVTTLLAELDGVKAKQEPECQPITICSSNYPDMIDSALLSRFTRVVIPLPDKMTVQSILQKSVGGDYSFGTSCSPERIAEMAVSRHYSGREINELLASASERMLKDMNPAFAKKYLSLNPKERRSFKLKTRPFTLSDFEPGLQSIRSPLTPADLKRYAAS